MAEDIQLTETRMRAIISEMMQSQLNSFMESFRSQQNLNVILCICMISLFMTFILHLYYFFCFQQNAQPSGTFDNTAGSDVRQEEMIGSPGTSDTVNRNFIVKDIICVLSWPFY